jgi:hypothetical protein
LAREAIQVIIRLAGQAPHRRAPLSSNVRPHTNYLMLNALFGGAGLEFEDLGALDRARSRRLKCVEAQRRRGTDTKSMATAGAPRTDLGFFGLRPRSLSSSSRLVGLARAARPPAGGSPNFARGRAVQTGRSVAALWNYGRVWYEIEHMSCRGASSGSIQGQPKHRASTQVQPNPSFEPTRSGMALGPRGSVVHHPPRGPSATPPRSAQLKR